MNQIIWPYWRSAERWGAIGLLVLLLLLAAINSGLLVLFSVLLGELTTPLSTGDWGTFQQILLLAAGFAIVAIPLAALKPFVQSRLAWYWRRWLTQHLLDRYLSHQNYHYLGFVLDLDNPDQRIAEDVRNFTQQSLALLVTIVEAVLQLIAFAGLLWQTSPLLMGLLLIYAGVGNVVTIGGFGRKLLPLNLVQLQRETDFRFGLARLRDNAESIAFYRGEAQESAQLTDRFARLFQTTDRLLAWQYGLDYFQLAYQAVPFFLPAIVLAPDILAGRLPVGAFVQSGIGFKSVLNALAVIINQFEQFSQLAAGIQRLTGLNAWLAAPDRATPQLSKPQLSIRETNDEASWLKLDNLRLNIHDRRLFNPLDLTLNQDESLLIMGPSGIGKTTLLRAISGLWQDGSGAIQRPPRGDILFLPQRAYWIEGSLRDQLQYPKTIGDDNALQQSLNYVGLAALGEAGLDRRCDWGQVLSGGEQQRLSWARLLVQRPRYAIFDEATSALDEPNEARLYQLLAPAGIRYISIGHRSSLKQFHDRVLNLS